jgi:hypothetical protein
MRTTTTDPDTQLAQFTRAVELLGGQRATARYLKVSERTIRFLLAGERALHDGWLRDVSAALIAHADECRQMERQLSPAFASNLTAEQARRQGAPDARRFDRKGD